MAEAFATRMHGSPLGLFAAMAMLAALDFFGAVFAKEWAERHNHWLFAAGLLTFGWIVSLQVGLLPVERFRYAVAIPQGKWVAIVLILLLQAYLVPAPNGRPA